MTNFNKYFLVVLSMCVIGSFVYIFNLQSTDTSISIATPTAIILGDQKQNQETTLMFAGDAMFGRAVYNQFHDNLTDAFLSLGQDFFKGDVTILNLEGPMVENEFIPDLNPDNLIMKFPPQTKDTLKWLGINTVSLANNHTGNQGAPNLAYTRQILADSQITTIGDPQNSTDLVKSFSNDNQKTISIIAVNAIANTPDLEGIIKEQKNNNNFVIIFPHWGGEYETSHNLAQQKLAHTWIDEGADMIIGSHPHVVQDAELYNKKPIFYSLGNFIFDQTFSQNTQRGLILKAKINDKKLSLEILPTQSTHLRVSLMEGEEKDKIIRNFQKLLGVEENNTKLIELDLNN